jgi:hypothetical protein
MILGFSLQIKTSYISPNIFQLYYILLEQRNLRIVTPASTATPRAAGVAGDAGVIRIIFLVFD